MEDGTRPKRPRGSEKGSGEKENLTSLWVDSLWGEKEKEKEKTEE